MRRQDFTGQIPGELVSIGDLGIAFLPHDLPPEFVVDGELQRAHEEALLPSANCGRLSRRYLTQR